MFNSKTVDGIVGNIAKQIDDLKDVAATQAAKASYLESEHRAAVFESERAERLASKFWDLIS